MEEKNEQIKQQFNEPIRFISDEYPNEDPDAGTQRGDHSVKPERGGEFCKVKTDRTGQCDRDGSESDQQHFQRSIGIY